MHFDRFIAVRQMLEPASYGAAAEAFTSYQDCSGYSELLVVVSVGIITATGDVAIQLEEDADGTGNGTDISGALFPDTTLVVATDQTVYVGRINLDNRERYIRAGYDVDDDAAIFGITFLLVNPKYGPATQTNALVFDL